VHTHAAGEPNCFKARVYINMGVAFERSGQMDKTSSFVSGLIFECVSAGA
jgi:hypothetical protein